MSKKQKRPFISYIGPGLISGAADNDPSTIATFSQAGAVFGLGLLWLALFQYPLKTIIPEMCARVGLVTGSGLGAVINKKYSWKVVAPFAALLLIANTISVEFSCNMGYTIMAKNFMVKTLCISPYLLLLKASLPSKNSSVVSAIPSANPACIS